MLLRLRQIEDTRFGRNMANQTLADLQAGLVNSQRIQTFRCVQFQLIIRTQT